MVEKRLRICHVLSINERMVLRDSSTIKKTGLSFVPRTCVDFHSREQCDSKADEKGELGEKCCGDVQAIRRSPTVDSIDLHCTDCECT